MKRRYILYRRKRGGMFYIEDTETRKQESTGTRNRAEATYAAQRPQRIHPPAATESPDCQGIPGWNGFRRRDPDMAASP